LNYPTSIRIVEYNTGSGIFTDYGPGMRGHFSSDDSRIVHLDSGRTYVYSLDVGSRNATRLTKKGSFNWTDARP
jgi:Tol biopolymer transport system component